ncbi:HAMP domain-containing protein [Nitrincola sp.]|uniref:HAMP domain-containing protein n=1 Tax=Nitrincola sp. TaxID=1926584 RepID=UPI003A8E31EC
MNWVNRSLFNKLLAIIVGGCLLIMIAGVFYFMQVNQGIQRYNQLISQEVAMERAINLMQSEFKTQVQEWKNVLIRGEKADQLERFWNSFQHQEDRVQKIGNDLLQIMPEGTERQTVTEFIQAHQTMGQEYRTGYQQFVASGFDHRVGDQAVAGIDREPSRLLNLAATELADSAIQEASMIPAEVENASILAALLLLIAILLFGVVALLVVNLAIVKPSRSLISAIQDLSEGRLDTSIAISRTDELGVLAESARQLQQFLLQIAGEMRKATTELTESTAQLSGISDNIIDHAAKTNDSASLVATAMEQMAPARGRYQQYRYRRWCYSGNF